jgi:hypothetical protein
MTMHEVQGFFDAYREAFNRLDGDAVADLWHSSSGIADNHGEGGSAHLTWWPSDAPMRANHRALCDLYRDNGYACADFEIEHHVPLGPNHAFAHLHWTLTRADGSLLQQFHTGYQLMRTADGPKVVLAVAHQENIQEMKRHAAQ